MNQHHIVTFIQDNKFMRRQY